MIVEALDAYLVRLRSIVARVERGEMNPDAVVSHLQTSLQKLEEAAAEIRALQSFLSGSHPDDRRCVVLFDCNHREILSLSKVRAINETRLCSLCSDREGLFCA